MSNINQFRMRHPPQFCPGCGKVLFGNNAWVEYWLHFTKKGGYEGLGYDAFCQHCSWSGNIEPDKDDDYIDTE